MTDQQQHAVIAGLKALATRSEHAGASAAVECAVLAEMARHNSRARLSGFSARFGALAAGLVIAIAGGVWTLRSVPPAPPAFVQPLGFVPVPGASILPDLESAQIVRVSVPIGALPVYGLPVVRGTDAYSVQADLLIAQDGQPRAIRLVNQSTSRSSTRE